MAQVKQITVSATMADGFRVESDIRGHKLCIDQPKATGGTDCGPTPLEYLFLSLGGCIASIARIVASQEKLPVRGVTVTVSGPIDLSGLLGTDRMAQIGFQEISIKVAIDADMDRAAKEDFLKRVDSRCPVSDNLTKPTPIRVMLED